MFPRSLSQRRKGAKVRTKDLFRRSLCTYVPRVDHVRSCCRFARAPCVCLRFETRSHEATKPRRGGRLGILDDPRCTPFQLPRLDPPDPETRSLPPLRGFVASCFNNRAHVRSTSQPINARSRGSRRAPARARARAEIDLSFRPWRLGVLATNLGHSCGARANPSDARGRGSRRAPARARARAEIDPPISVALWLCDQISGTRREHVQTTARTCVIDARRLRAVRAPKPISAPPPSGDKRTTTTNVRRLGIRA